MSYFCYIHRQAGGVPHFEVLPETSQGAAREEAARLLAQRADGVLAEVWEGEQLIFTVPREAAPAVTDHNLGQVSRQG